MEHMGECLRAVSEELSLIKCNVYWSKGSTSSCITLGRGSRSKRIFIDTFNDLEGLWVESRTWGAAPVCCVLVNFRLDEVDNAGHLSSANNLC